MKLVRIANKSPVFPTQRSDLKPSDASYHLCSIPLRCRSCLVKIQTVWDPSKSVQTNEVSNRETNGSIHFNGVKQTSSPAATLHKASRLTVLMSLLLRPGPILWPQRARKLKGFLVDYL